MSDLYSTVLGVVLGCAIWLFMLWCWYKYQEWREYRKFKRTLDAIERKWDQKWREAAETLEKAIEEARNAEEQKRESEAARSAEAGSDGGRGTESDTAAENLSR